MSERPAMSRPLRVAAEFDPANQAVVDALRRSFALLRWLMLLVLVLYGFSGVFRVRPGEVGYVLRVGRIAGSELGPGWHWSWPFPIDEARTMSIAGERSVTASFMYQLTEDERVKGPTRVSMAPLRPGRDNYLVTGDLNILHAELQAQYKIVAGGAIDYLRHVFDVSPADERPPEYELVSGLLSTAAIEAAAGRSVDDVYKDRSGFLEDVQSRINDRLEQLAAAGTPLGLRIERVIATSFAGIEAISPPRAVIDEFEAVQSAEQKKGQTISEARGRARELLSRTAGTVCDDLAVAVEAEYAACRSRAATLPALRQRTEALLRAASGEVGAIIKQAEAERDRLVSRANGDAAAVESLAAEYQRAPDVFRSQHRQYVFRELMQDPFVNKKITSDALHQVRLIIPRDPADQERASRQRSAARPDEPREKPPEIDLSRIRPRLAQ